VVLTGMGNDGAQGVRHAKKLGAQVIAESEETAVVFGMPREAIAAGAAVEVLSLAQIGPALVARAGRSA